MGIEKFVAHPLNAKGLHPLRALLAERLAHQRVTPLLTAGLGAVAANSEGGYQHTLKDGSTAVASLAELHQYMLRDGILVLPNFTSPRVGPFFIQLLRLVSGYTHLDLEGFSSSWERFEHFTGGESDSSLCHVAALASACAFLRTRIAYGLHAIQTAHRRPESHRHLTAH